MEQNIATIRLELHAAMENHARLARLIDCSHEALLRYTSDGTVLSPRRARKNVLGYTGESFPGRSIFKSSTQTMSIAKAGRCRHRRHGTDFDQDAPQLGRMDPSKCPIHVVPSEDGTIPLEIVAAIRHENELQDQVDGRRGQRLRGRSADAAWSNWNTPCAVHRRCIPSGSR